MGDKVRFDLVMTCQGESVRIVKGIMETVRPEVAEMHIDASFLADVDREDAEFVLSILDGMADTVSDVLNEDSAETDDGSQSNREATR